MDVRRLLHRSSHLHLNGGWLRRGFSWTPGVLSRIGKSPLPYHPNEIQIQYHSPYHPSSSSSESVNEVNEVEYIPPNEKNEGGMGKTSHPPLTERDFDRRPPYPVTLIGPKGSFTSYLKPCVQLHFRPCPLPTLPTLPTSSSIPMKMHMHVTVDHPDLKRQRTIWGTTRSLLANMMVGITQGWTWYVKVVGVGYRVSVIELPSPPSPSSTFPQEEEEEKEEKEKESSMGGSVPPRTVVVQLDVGYAHPIHVPVPVALHVQDQLTVEALSVDTLRIMGMDKMKVAQLAATLRKHRPPEPYHLKGIFVNNETIQKKKSKKR